MSDAERVALRRRLKGIEAGMEANLQGAEETLQAMVAERPDEVEIRILLARIYFRRSGFKEMQEQAEAALALQPRLPGAAHLYALSIYYQGDIAAAAEAFRRQVEIQANHGALNRLACCQHRLGQLEAALENHDRALTVAYRAEPRWVTIARYGMMSVLRDLGRGEEADQQAGEILTAYGFAPLATSSMLLGFYNRMDFHEWDRYRKKEELSESIQAYREAKGQDAFPEHPRTYALPRDYEAFQRDAAAGLNGPLWIMKPTALYGGQGMYIVDDPAKVPREAGYIVQDYLADPFLVKGRKAHFRLYLVITSLTPLRAYLWGDGLVRIAPELYREGPGWLERQAMHITNTALHKGHPDLKLANDASKEDEGNIWTQRALMRHLEREGADVPALRQRLRDLAARVIRVIEHSGLFARQAEAPTPRAYPPKFFGMDVMLDSQLRPWLLECQRMPGQTGTPVVEGVNGRLFTTIFEMMVDRLGADASEWPARELALELEKRGDFQPLDLD